MQIRGARGHGWPWALLAPDPLPSSTCPPRPRSLPPPRFETPRRGPSPSRQPLSSSSTTTTSTSSGAAPGGSVWTSSARTMSCSRPSSSFTVASANSRGGRRRGRGSSRILLRVVHDHRRSLRRKSPYWFQPSLDPNLVPDDTSGSNPEEALQRAEASRTIDRLLDSLDGDKRAVFVLAELEEMNAEEIGQAIGLDRKAVYSRLRAARIDFERAAARLRRQERRDDRRTR